MTVLYIQKEKNTLNKRGLDMYNEKHIEMI